MPTPRIKASLQLHCLPTFHLVRTFWRLTLGLCGAWPGSDGIAADRPLNVLFIAVDDLRPELGAYGNKEIHSPNIDWLAARGVVFERAYCQYSVCNPSRTSLLSGLRPDSSGVRGNEGDFRDANPGIVTLPQQFKQHGYVTRAFGKIFHSCFERAYVGRRLEDRPSWSEAPWYGRPQHYFSPEGMAAARKAFAAGTVWPRYELAAGANAPTPEQPKGDPDAWQEAFVQVLSTEAPEVADSTPYDGQVTERAIETLRALQHQPFFLAVGLMKPHLPFVAPKRYWDLYDRSRLSLPRPSHAPHDAPAVALPRWAELRGQYSDIPKTGPLSEAKVRELIHGYRACVSYVDALIGQILGELDRLGLRDCTVVVLWGDHGWHLGEQNHWGKATAFEFANRVPLIVSAPTRKGNGARCQRLVELVDVFPSICELAGLPLPAHLEGTSFVPLPESPGRPWKSAAFSQVRFGTVEGRTLRTERHRFALWRDRREPGTPVAEELYDLRNDASEEANAVHRPENATLVQELRTRLEDGWQAVRSELAASLPVGSGTSSRFAP